MDIVIFTGIALTVVLLAFAAYMIYLTEGADVKRF
jgi:hypothetical protein